MSLACRPQGRDEAPGVEESASPDSACVEVEEFWPQVGYYNASADMVTAGCGDVDPYDGFYPALWVPQTMIVSDTAPGSFVVDLVAMDTHYAYPLYPQLTCILHEDQTFDCVDDAIAIPDCTAEMGVLVVVFALSGSWDTYHSFQGTLTYDLQWAGRDPETNPCLGPCTSAWTFQAERT